MIPTKKIPNPTASLSLSLSLAVPPAQSWTWTSPGGRKLGNPGTAGAGEGGLGGGAHPARALSFCLSCQVFDAFLKIQETSVILR